MERCVSRTFSTIGLPVFPVFFYFLKKTKLVLIIRRNPIHLHRAAALLLAEPTCDAATRPLSRCIISSAFVSVFIVFSPQRGALGSFSSQRANNPPAVPLLLFLSVKLVPTSTGDDCEEKLRSETLPSPSRSPVISSLLVLARNAAAATGQMISVFSTFFRFPSASCPSQLTVAAASENVCAGELDAVWVNTASPDLGAFCPLVCVGGPCVFTSCLVLFPLLPDVCVPVLTRKAKLRN